MNRNRYSIVFDFETDSTSVEAANIVQVAAVPIDLRNLSILTSDIFCMDVKPAVIDDVGYFESHERTITWHAGIQKKTVDEVLNRWKAGYNERDAWEEFAGYIKNFSKGGQWDQRPIPAGQNIRGYDLPICEKFSKKYRGLSFSQRDVFDLMDFSRAWFMFTPDGPSSLSMDTLRDFFGLDKVGAHDAKKDVLDCAEILCKFLGLHERIAPKVKWNNSQEV